MTLEQPDQADDIRPAPRRCELCGVRNFALGGRDSDGMFHPAYEVDAGPDVRVKVSPGRKGWCGKHGPQLFLKLFRVICQTVEVRDRRTGELESRYLCQRCETVVKAAGKADDDARAA